MGMGDHFEDQNQFVRENGLKLRGSLKTDTIAEATAGSGVTIDGVTLKDGAVGASGALSADTVSENTTDVGVTVDGALLKDSHIVDSVGFFDAAAPTKIARIDAGNVTAGNTRVITAPDWDVDLDYSLRRAFVTLSSAQILALFTTPITVIAAPGAGKFIEIQSIHPWLDFNSAAYVPGGSNLEFRYVNGSGSRIGYVTSTGFLDAVADAHRVIVPGGGGSAYTATDANNAAVVAYISLGNPITGDSPVKLEILYRVRTFEPA